MVPPARPGYTAGVEPTAARLPSPTSAALAPLPPGVSLEEPPCPLCGEPGGRTLLRIPDLLFRRPGLFGLVRCGGCGLVRSSPRPTRDSLGFYYAGAYSGEATADMRQAQTEGAAGLLQHARWGQLNLHVQLTPADRLLDVGCGYGAFLRLLGDKTGCQLFGVDLDAGSLAGSVVADRATLFAGTLEQAAFPDDHFAAVTLFHSLEHMPDPVATLREVGRILRPGGVLYVELPNFQGLLRRICRQYWFPLLMPQHLCHFAPATIRQALAAAGFGSLLNLRPCWAPAELSLCLGLWLHAHRQLAAPPTTPAAPTAGEGRTPRPRPLIDRLLAPLFVLLFLLVDLPLSGLLRLTRLSGHLLAVARKDPPRGAGLLSG